MALIGFHGRLAICPMVASKLDLRAIMTGVVHVIMARFWYFQK